jgi:HlyD family secretion protein
MMITGSGFVEEGAMVRQRQELIKLPDVSKMLAEVKIHESRVRQVTAGMPAYLKIETIPGKKFRGSVRRVGILPDAQASWANPDVKVYATDILIEDHLPDMRPGISARAEIIITNLVNVLWVPIHAVVSHQSQQVCFVDNGGGPIPVPVSVGLFNDRFIEVKSGLKEGDRVLLAPPTDSEAAEMESSSSETNQPPPEPDVTGAP